MPNGCRAMPEGVPVLGGIAYISGPRSDCRLPRGDVSPVIADIDKGLPPVSLRVPEILTGLFPEINSDGPRRTLTHALLELVGRCAPDPGRGRRCASRG